MSNNNSDWENCSDYSEDECAVNNKQTDISSLKDPLIPKTTAIEKEATSHIPVSKILQSDNIINKPETFKKNWKRNNFYNEKDMINNSKYSKNYPINGICDEKYNFYSSPNNNYANYNGRNQKYYNYKNYPAYSENYSSTYSYEYKTTTTKKKKKKKKVDLFEKALKLKDKDKNNSDEKVFEVRQQNEDGIKQADKKGIINFSEEINNDIHEHKNIKEEIIKEDLELSDLNKIQGDLNQFEYVHDKTETSMEVKNITEELNKLTFTKNQINTKSHKSCSYLIQRQCEVELDRVIKPIPNSQIMNANTRATYQNDLIDINSLNLADLKKIIENVKSQIPEYNIKK